MKKNNSPPATNLHVHTPYSFSFFASIPSLVEKAAEEKIVALGINDFYTTEGYDEFTEECLRKNIYPVYGLEVIAVNLEDKKNGILWNDPNNPGRIYLCGKGLLYPQERNDWVVSIINRIKDCSQKRMKKMVEKVSDFFARKSINIPLNYEQIKDSTPSGWVRERHIAREIYASISENKEEKAKLCQLLGIEETAGSIAEQLRGKLLKFGGVAYVEEDNDAFLSPEEARQVFLNSGGIPVYPVLSDGAPVLTDKEKSPNRLSKELKKMGYWMAEFIPPRNSSKVLKKYVKALREEEIVVTCGTEHNSLKGGLLTPLPKGMQYMDEELTEIFWEGCCIVAAHQYLRKVGEEGFVDQEGKRTAKSLSELREIGEFEINSFLAEK
ncbi:MAG: PHP domain-containing protein [Caldiserica bacterium]|nr:PHP domain-containing protein [Caldisericota bacterium]